jgi:hypothetical protein
MYIAPALRCQPSNHNTIQSYLVRLPSPLRFDGFVVLDSLPRSGLATRRGVSPPSKNSLKRVARILALIINDMTGGSRVRMGIGVALREPLPKPSPAYGSHFKTMIAMRRNHKNLTPIKYLNCAYGFGETRLATLALLTLTTLSGSRFRGVVIARFPSHVVSLRNACVRGTGTAGHKSSIFELDQATQDDGWRNRQL